jgi:hypothetical protein
VRGHEARRIGLDIHELAPQHILAQQYLADAALEASEVQFLTREPHRAGLQLGDLVDRNEQLASADPRLQTGDRRIAAVGETHNQIFDAPETLARAIQ